MRLKGKNSDRSKTILWFVVTVTAILIIISFIPPITIGGMKLKRVNVLSVLIDFHDSIVSNQTSADILDTTCLNESSALAFLDAQLGSKGGNDYLALLSDSSAADSLLGNAGQASDPLRAGGNVVQLSDEDNVMLSSVDSLTQCATESEAPVYEFNHAGIEDYSHNGEMIDRFLRALTVDSKTRNVRIAFLGDSFIEGDILTSDFRRQLQSEYGGEGLGFIPFADPIGKYRPLINQEFYNWTCYNLLRKKNVPAKYKNDFYVSGYVSVPKPGAVATFTPRSSKQGSSSLSSARIIFKNRGETEMKVIVNNADTLDFVLQQKEEVQQINIHEQNIRSLTVKLPKCNEFIGYGVVFLGEKGVNVDNYGLRSNSGLNMFSTELSVNQQINDMLHYDLVVMEYGLNALRKDVTNYDYYASKLERLVDYIKICFPKSAILLISVGDIGMKKDNTIITAPAVKPMVKAQRKIAKNSRVAFWNLFSAMGGENSIQRFVSNGWAAKDYLHINHKGGHEISNLLIRVLNDQLNLYEQKTIGKNKEYVEEAAI